MYAEKSLPWRIWASPPKSLLNICTLAFRQPPLSLSFLLYFCSSCMPHSPWSSGLKGQSVPDTIDPSGNGTFLLEFSAKQNLLWGIFWTPILSPRPGGSQAALLSTIWVPPASAWPSWLPSGQILVVDVPYTKPEQRARRVAADPTAEGSGGSSWKSIGGWLTSWEHSSILLLTLSPSSPLNSVFPSLLSWVIDKPVAPTLTFTLRAKEISGYFTLAIWLQ